MKTPLLESGDRPYLRVLRPNALGWNALDLDPSALQARFDWAVRQGHPHYYWPEFPVHVWRACLFEIERATSQILSEGRAELRPPADASPRALGIAAFSAGVGPLLGHWIDTGALKVDPEVGRLLELHLRHARLRAQRMKSGLIDLLAILERAGTQVTVIKSAHTGATYFSEPALRPAADIDIVVSPADLKAAARQMESAGYVPTGNKHASKCDWLPPGVVPMVCSLELTHADNGYHFDVHDSLDRSFGGIHNVRIGDLTELTEPWPELAPNARRLRPIANTAVIALHVSEEWHRLQLIRIVELVLMLRRDFGQNSAAWGDLLALADRSHAHAFFYPAFELVERLAPGTLRPEFRQQLSLHTHDRLVRVIGSLRPATANRIEQSSVDETLLWANGPWQVVRRLLDMIWPIRASRSSRAIRRIYRERFFRLLRGRFRWR